MQNFCKKHVRMRKIWYNNRYNLLQFCIKSKLIKTGKYFMNLVREKVIHKKYGTGEITKLDNDHVYVKFQSVDQEKIF